MGTQGLLRSRELRQYILDTSVHPREPQILKDLRNATLSHPLAIMQTDPDSGQMLALLLEMVGAEKTLEIGVFTGYSLLLTAVTIPHHAKVTAIDPDRNAYEIGLPFIKEAGVEHKINFINSLAHPALDQLLQNAEEMESYDLAFVDADKGNYGKYHEKMLKLVKPGGIIVYDNTLWLGTVAEDEDSVPGYFREGMACIKEFNKMIAADSRVHICHLPCGDGMTICRRL